VKYKSGKVRYKSVDEQIDDLLRIVNLTDAAYKKIGGFSGGMKQRVLLAQALLGNPVILILDEPTAGLDPKERIGIRNYIAELGKNKIILYATHVVSDIECIADKVLILKSGEIIADGTPSELIEAMSGKVGEINCTLDEVKKLQKKYKVGNIRQRKDGLALRIVGDTLPEEAKPVDTNMDLEDVYLYYFD
jgi:ABC-type multidrug transport system ATPase subunit